jgi:hypothetical protein
VVPDGLAVRGDTTVIATADGLQITTDDGATWTAVGDSTGPPARGPADRALALLDNEYVLGLAADARGWLVRTLRGVWRLRHHRSGWRVLPTPAAKTLEGNAIVIGGRRYLGSRCGLQPAGAVRPCLVGPAPAADPPAAPRTAWLRRPIGVGGNIYLDQTYRYGSTMGGNFQQHQGVEFNNPDGTPVHAIGPGVVLCEVQQASDNTFRLDDYGRGRPLHLEHGLAVARATSGGLVEHGLTLEQSGLLLDTPYFQLVRHQTRPGWTLPPASGLRWIVNLAGDGPVPRGCVAELASGTPLAATSRGTWLEVRVPKP